MTEKNYNRDILKAFIAKQIFRCKNNEYYIFGILLSDSEKLKLVNQICEEVIKEQSSKHIRRIVHNFNENVISFDNGSLLKIVTACENARGHRYHALAIDSNISEELKEGVCYCKFIDYPCQFMIDKNVESEHKPIINGRADMIEINIE